MLTQIVRPFLAQRQKQIERYEDEAENIQRHVLQHLLKRAENTQFGVEHNFSALRSYEDYRQAVPLGDYETHKARIETMRKGTPNVLWPGKCQWFAKSSGTTNDRSKFIPVTDEGLRNLHLRGGRDAVNIYLKNRPDSRFMDGRALILGGSFDHTQISTTSKSGDLSAILIHNTPHIAEYRRTPTQEIALLNDFEEKRDRIAEHTLHQDVRSLSGVPSWMMAVLKRVLELAGTDNIADVWPHLEVFWHGGVAFGPYRDQYKQLIRTPLMQYMETYNASEGFFGIQSDPHDPALLLMVDYDCFYEFVPTDTDGAEPIPLWEVEPGRNYAVVISTSCGLWRYQIGDTVRFTQTAPYKFVISGRTKCFINAFGEELMVDNAEQGLMEVCRRMGLSVKDYTAAPVFMDDEGKCRHQWAVEFTSQPTPSTVAEFAAHLDEALRRINSDYDAKRFHDITLQPLELISVPSGTFDTWLKNQGKLGGQHKVPRLSNERRIINAILNLV